MTDVLARKADADAAVEALFLFDRDRAESHVVIGVPTPPRPSRPVVPDSVLDAAVSLRGRRPGAGLLHRAVELQAEAEPRTAVAKLFGIDPLTPDAATWYRGALGEFAVAQVLDRLGEGWTVLHAVPIGAGSVHGAPADIDHVVIGPGGVFTVTTKHHPGKQVRVAGTGFLVDGAEQPYVGRALAEREDASTRLSVAVSHRVDVESVIVLVESERVAEWAKPAVPVLHPGELLAWLRARPTIWNDAQVAAVVAAAERPSTWRRRADILEPGEPDAAAFGELDAEVRGARLRRTAWVAAASLALSVAVTTMVATTFLGA